MQIENLILLKNLLGELTQDLKEENRYEYLSGSFDQIKDIINDQIMDNTLEKTKLNK